MSGRRGVLLLAFGGPDSLEDVAPFLRRLFGRDPAPHLVAEVTERYRLVGGRSPLPETTRAQARALADRLAAEGDPAPAWVGLRYGRPAIDEALRAMAADGITGVAAVSMAPYRAGVSTDNYENEVREALGRLGLAGRLRVAFAPDWYAHPGFIAALAERLAEGLAAFPAERRQTVPVIFSAHSLPVGHIAAGDPYVEQLEATARALAARFGRLRWRLAFQSKGAARVEWLGPQVEEALDELAAAGEREVLLHPIGFVADHMETLYDNDILHRAHAERLGLRFVRCACPNTSPAFIAALADIARSTFALLPAGETARDAGNVADEPFPRAGEMVE